MRGNFLGIHTDVSIWQKTLSGLDLNPRARCTASGQQFAWWCLGGRSQGSARCLVRIPTAFREGGKVGTRMFVIPRTDSESTAEWFSHHETSYPAPAGHRGKCYLSEGPQRQHSGWQSGQVSKLTKIKVGQVHFCVSVLNPNSRTLGGVVGGAVGGPAGGPIGSAVGGTLSLVRKALRR